MACILSGSKSTSGDAPWAPRYGLGAGEACLGQATCRPYTTSKRAIRARSENCHEISFALLPIVQYHVRIELLVLVVDPAGSDYTGQTTALLSKIPDSYGEAPPPSSRSTCCRTCPGRSGFRLWYRLGHISTSRILPAFSYPSVPMFYTCGRLDQSICGLR